MANIKQHFWQRVFLRSPELRPDESERTIEMETPQVFYKKPSDTPAPPNRTKTIKFLFAYFLSFLRRKNTEFTPAIALMGDKTQALLIQGDSALALTEHTRIVSNCRVSGWRQQRILLRVGTYGRRNACHLQIRIRSLCFSVSTTDFIDNALVNIPLPQRIYTYPNQSVRIEISSPDACLRTDNLIAVWGVKNRPSAWLKPSLPVSLPTTTGKADISIIVLDDAHLPQTLTALAQLEVTLQWELIVLTRQAPIALPQGTRCLPIAANMSVSAAYQYAVKHAQADNLLFLQSGCGLFSEDLNHLYAALQHHALVNPRLLKTNGYLHSAGGQLCADGDLYQWAATLDGSHPDFLQPRQLAVCAAPCVAVKRSLWQQLQGLSPAYHSLTAAWAELSLAAQSLGQAAHYCPQARVICSQTAATLNAKDKQTLYQRWFKATCHSPYSVMNLSLPNQLYLTADTAPQVSIVIPLFNQWRYTLNCLRSLLKHDTHISKEVILIDNASSDATARLLACLHGNFRVVRNADNCGFVEACNQGVKLARAPYVMLLNNDTQVCAGYLQALLQPLQSTPQVGITGAKLIYPDGRLQEAGGVVFNDASAANVGRAGDALDADYQIDRTVDYCSAAAMMIRRDIWQQLGGLDMRYAPAYYEDTDLCFATWAAGYQVRYCHQAVVIHFEGITAGVDSNSGFKRYQVRNQQRFAEKWAQTLCKQPPTETPLKHAVHWREDKI